MLQCSLCFLFAFTVTPRSTIEPEPDLLFIVFISLFICLVVHALTLSHCTVFM